MLFQKIIYFFENYNPATGVNLKATNSYYGYINLILSNRTKAILKDRCAADLILEQQEQREREQQVREIEFKFKNNNIIYFRNQTRPKLEKNPSLLILRR